MITLHSFGPAFGLPDPSPFVTKAEVLLKLSGLPYRKVVSNFRKAPKGKLPWIDDDGTAVADSTFIRFHLEERHGIDFDKGLGPEQKGAAWAIEKLLEDHLYWAIVDNRWLVEANFDKGPRRFFQAVPAPVRPLVVAMVRRNVRKNLWAQGMGRHARADIERLAARGVMAVAGMLGDKPFLCGNEPCGADATLFAFVSGLLIPEFQSPTRDLALAQPNLVAYVERGRQRWYPEMKSPGASA